MPNLSQRDNKDDVRPRMEQDKSCLIIKGDGEEDKRPIAIIELEADEKLDVQLGVYDENNPPKGFIVESRSLGSVKSNILTTRTSGSMYDLKLSLENNSNTAVSVEVWELN